MSDLKSEFEKLLDQMAMHELGSKGTTLAHMFLQDRLGSPLRGMHQLSYYSRGGACRVFIPPNKEEDRVVMFSDYSGVYVCKDGLFCTPMGPDISHEVVKWQEVLK